MPTKLLYITNRVSGSGGLERVLSIKAGMLAENYDYEIHIITLDQQNEALFYQFSDQLIFHDVNTKGSFWGYLKGLRNKVKSIKPDIISVCDDGLKGFFVPYFLRKPCPMIYERHASKNIFINSDNSSWVKKIQYAFYNWLMNFGGKNYDSLVVLTNENLKEWNLKNLKVIANPLSFFPTKKATLSAKKVIAVGSHNFQKGFDRLLTIWLEVVKEFPDWKLDIYGKIDADKKYVKQAIALGLQETVSFHKPVKDIQEKYNKSSVFVLPSRSEGFGMVLIEAMANGVPCVSFECPSGPKDIITHSEDGFLVENGNLEAFTRYLKLLMNDENLRTQMGEKARDNINRYLPEVILPEWDYLFKSLIEKE
ncbi:glycosyltransferase family 4 protein [Spongiivirga sp. MCCC 1A20706]|uniref:glycosyltransferase family 4 protein n=1 Tax=Spongiivirga sp. MCCC 1A20706 TaxID=3160963 RepID=UPI003977A005